LSGGFQERHIGAAVRHQASDKVGHQLIDLDCLEAKRAIRDESDGEKSSWGVLARKFLT
jgi:hypothetical protein